MISLEKQLESIVKVVRQLHHSKFWGGITINFSEGNVSSIEARQVMKAGYLSPVVILESEDELRKENQETPEELRKEKRSSEESAG